MESGKWKKVLMSFWGCLSIKRTILLFGAGIGREAEAGTFRQPGAFKELLGEEVRVDYHSTGAPFLACVPLYISISHTKDYVAVILDKRPTGIDIEYRSDRILKIRSRFMNPEEEAGIDLEHEVEHLLIHWCAKETLFKIIGQEGVDFQKHLHVNPFPYLSSGTFKGRETRTEACREYELAYQVTPDYVLTWLK